MSDLNEGQFKKLQAHLKTCWDFDAQRAESDEPGFEFVRQAISKATPELRRIRLPVDEVSIALVRGNGSSNGHACLIDGKPVAWFAVEGYPSQERADVFVPHELIHAIHYSLSPDYAFETKEKKNELGRQLVTEGIATRLTAFAMNMTAEAALWADAQPIEATKRWMNDIVSTLPKRRPEILNRWNQDAGELFLANDPSDPYRYRAGYAIGASAIQAVLSTTDLAPKDLLSLPRTELDELVRSNLLSRA